MSANPPLIGDPANPRIDEPDVPRERHAVSYAIFEADDRTRVEALARNLALDNHYVALHEGDQFTRRRLPIEATRWRDGAARGALMVAAAAVALLIVLRGFGLAMSVPIWSVVALGLFLGAIAGGLSGSTMARAELAEVERLLESPGRFAVTVSSGRARRPWVLARLHRAGALATGSI